MYVFQNISEYLIWSLRVWLSFCSTFCQFPLGVAYISVTYKKIGWSDRSFQSFLHCFIFNFHNSRYFIGILNCHNDKPPSLTVITTSRDDLSICEWPIWKLHFQKNWSNCRSPFWNDRVTLVKLIFSGLLSKYIFKVLLNGS